MTSSNPGSERPLRRRPNPARFSTPQIFATVPPRVFGHALVVVMCLSVAYAGRSNHLADQLGLWSPQTEILSRSSLAVGTVGQASDALVRPPLADTQTASNQRMDLTHYEAQPGDTVTTLAERFDISENTIVWTNNLAADGHIKPGQQLVILPVSGVLYTVQVGDTLGDIARRFESDDKAIAQVNQLADPAQTIPGTQLIVPGGRLDTVSRADLSSRSTSRPVVDPTGNVLTNVLPPSLGVLVAPKPTTVVDNIADQVTHLPFAQRLQPVVPVPLVPIVYNVAAGDTLLAIADKFGVSGDSIAAASGIQGHGDDLTIDQKLVIPPVPGALHVVQEGDTLDAVAERYGASSEEIVKANGLVDPFILTIGQTLVVPGGQVPIPVSNPAPAPVVQPTPTTYTVQEGDNLSTIAASFSVAPLDLAVANGIGEPFVLQLGQQIVVRGGTQPAPRAPDVAQKPAPVAAQPAAPAPVAAVAPAPVVAVAKPTAVVVAAVVRPAPTPAPAAGVSGWNIVAMASRYLGSPYSWGGVGPTAFDCSGFVWYVYRRAGDPIPRDMWGQYQSGSHVSRAKLQPGDIVFFAGTYGAGLSHDGIYIGGGRFISAADYGIGVTVSSFTAYWSAHYYGAVRPW